MDGDAERLALEIEQRHLDGGLGLEGAGQRLVHEGERALNVERIASAKYRGEARGGGGDVVHRFERVPGRGIDVAPPFDAVVAGHADEHALLHRRDAVNAGDGLPQWDFHDHRFDSLDAHRGLLARRRGYPMDYPRRMKQEKTLERRRRARVVPRAAPRFDLVLRGGRGSIPRGASTASTASVSVRGRSGRCFRQSTRARRCTRSTSARA